MNAKLRKTVKIVAAGLFLIALAINVKVTMEDPFNMSLANEQALAQQTTNKYDGPLCSDPSGTIYCCKGSDSSSSCAAGAKCSSCQ